MELEVTIPGEGKDRSFKVAIKWVSCVSLQALHEALSGRLPNIPFETIQALDVVMRHLPSMRLCFVDSVFHISPLGGVILRLSAHCGILEHVIAVSAGTPQSDVHSSLPLRAAPTPSVEDEKFGLASISLFDPPSGR